LKKILAFYRDDTTVLKHIFWVYSNLINFDKYREILIEDDLFASVVRERMEGEEEWPDLFGELVYCFINYMDGQTDDKIKELDYKYDLATLTIKSLFLFSLPISQLTKEAFTLLTK